MPGKLHTYEFGKILFQQTLWQFFKNFSKGPFLRFMKINYYIYHFDLRNSGVENISGNPVPLLLSGHSSFHGSFLSSGQPSRLHLRLSLSPLEFRPPLSLSCCYGSIASLASTAYLTIRHSLFGLVPALSQVLGDSGKTTLLPSCHVQSNRKATDEE